MDTPETVINGQTTQPENVSDTNVQQEQTNTTNPPPVITRYGRQVRPPVRYPDADN